MRLLLAQEAEGTSATWQWRRYWLDY